MNKPAITPSSDPASATLAAYSVRVRWALGLVLIVAVTMFWNTMDVLLGPELRLDLGSVTYPTERLKVVWNAFALWGTVSAVVLYVLLPSRRLASLMKAVDRHPRRVMALCVGVVFLGAVTTRVILLQFEPLTDDEAAYRFAAELLRNGRISIPTPVFGEFLERAFLIISDRVYSQYFLGWPAVLALGQIVGFEEFLNCILSALTVGPLALILRRFCSTPVVVGGVLIYSASMMVAVMGATHLTHPASTFFLLLFIERALCLLDKDLPTATLGLQCALAFSAAFFVRPGTALALGAPFLALLAFSLFRAPRRRWKAALGFTVAASVFGALFLVVNWVLYGGPFETGYAVYQRQLASGDLAAHFGRGTESSIDLIQEVIGQPVVVAKLLWAGVTRLSYDFIGWPLAVFPLSFIAVFWNRRLWLFVIGIASLLVMHSLILDLGIDSFGPVHLYEAGPMVLIVLCSGAQVAINAADRMGAIRWRGRWIASISPLHFLKVTLALGIAAWLLYFPIRIRNIYTMVVDIGAPKRAAEALKGEVVVFVPLSRWGFQTSVAPLRHAVLYMPINDMEFRNRVLWLRETEDIARNLAVLKHFPDREPYLLRWRHDGTPVMIPAVRSVGKAP